MSQEDKAVKKVIAFFTFLITFLLDLLYSLAKVIVIITVIAIVGLVIYAVLDQTNMLDTLELYYHRYKQ